MRLAVVKCDLTTQTCTSYICTWRIVIELQFSHITSSWTHNTHNTHNTEEQRLAVVGTGAAILLLSSNAAYLGRGKNTTDVERWPLCNVNTCQ